MDRNDIYGVDIYLDENGDMIPTRNGDVYSTKDYEHGKQIPFDSYYNILISIWRSLVTNQGDYVHHPEYGGNLMEFVSSTNPNIVAIVKSIVEQKLSQDRRIKEVVNIKVEKFGNTVYITALVELVITGRVLLTFPQLLLQ